MKKVLIAIGIFAVLISLLIISFPFIINLNKYKVQIEQEVNKKINGEFHFEKMGFRGLGIQIKNVILASSGNFKQKEILNVGEAKIKVSFLSLLTANPKVMVVLRKPQIYLVKNEEGILNITSLLKKEDSEPTATKSKLPALVLGAKISFVAENALLRFTDEKTSSATSVKNLQISLDNISLNSPIDFKLLAQLSSGVFEEKISLKGRAKLLTEGSRKLKGANFDAKIGVGDQSIHLFGDILNFETLQANLNVSTNQAPIEKLKNAILPLRKYSLKGTVSFSGNIQGPLKNFKECKLQARSDLRIVSKKTEISVAATLAETLHRIKGNIRIESPAIHVDDFLTKREGFLLASAYAEPLASKDFSDFRFNSILRGLSLEGSINVQKLVYRKTELNNMEGKFNLKNLQLSISKFRTDVFKGILSVKGDIRLDTSEPTYQVTTVAENFQVNPMITMFSPALKDVLLGVLNANMVISGSGFGFERIKKRLSGSGKVELKNVELKGLNMGEEIQEKLRLISIFAGSDILNEKLDSRIHFVRSSLFIRDGKLESPDAHLEAPAYKATLRGHTTFEKDINYQGSILIPAKKLSSSLASLADSNGMVGFPFALTGRLPRFTFSIDAAKVAQMAIRSTLKDSLKQKAKEKFGIDFPLDLPFP